MTFGLRARISVRLYRVLTAIVAAVCLAIMPGCSDEPEPVVDLTQKDIAGIWNVISQSPENTSVDPLETIQFDSDFRYYYYLKEDETKHMGMYSLEGNRITLREYINEEESGRISTIEVRRVEKKYLKVVYDGVTFGCERIGGLGLRPSYGWCETFSANEVPYNYVSLHHGGIVNVGACWISDNLVNLEVTGINGGHETGLEDDIVNYESEIRLNLNVDIRDYETAVWGSLFNLNVVYDADNVPLTYKVALPGQDPWEDSFKYNTYGYRLSDTNKGKIVYVDTWDVPSIAWSYNPWLVLRFKDVSFTRIDDNDSIPEQMAITGYITFSITDKRN